jgi:hypothetical protein
MSHYWDYDGTNYGLASSYPQLLVNRAPEIGGAQWVDIQKFFDLSEISFSVENPSGNAAK